MQKTLNKIKLSSIFLKLLQDFINSKLKRICTVKNTNLYKIV